MIAHRQDNMNQITQKDTGYFQGYQHGREDMKKALTIDLWEYANKIENLDPELHSLLTIWIVELEKKR
jgi:hypothetical protein